MGGSGRVPPGTLAVGGGGLARGVCVGGEVGAPGFGLRGGRGVVAHGVGWEGAGLWLPPEGGLLPARVG